MEFPNFTVLYFSLDLRGIDVFLYVLRSASAMHSNGGVAAVVVVSHELCSTSRRRVVLLLLCTRALETATAACVRVLLVRLGC